MIDPKDRAAFLAAVADIEPLPPPNRVQLGKPRPRRLTPINPRPPVAESSPRLVQPGQTLPEHWHKEAPRIQQGTLPADPDTLAFRFAMAGVQPLTRANRVVLGSPPPAPRPRQLVADERAALHESLHGQIDLQDRLEGGDEPHHLRQGLAISTLRDLRRGRWVIQAEIDLHGLNRDEARHRLANFMAGCLHHGQRCVRVIHGKGHGSPQRLSILRQLVRGWLAQREEVLAYCQAKPHDGGEGALIVLLRAPKNKR